MDIEQIKEFLINAWSNVFIQFLVATLGFIFFWWFTNKILNIFKKKLIKKGVDKLVVSVFFLLLIWCIRILLIIAYAGIVGIDTAGFAAIISSAGLALGLALQGSLSNLAGGIILALTRPFQLGDFIDVNGEVSGTIEDIKLFYSILVTPDNKVITVPNGKLANDIIINYSKKDLRRVDLNFCVSFEDDINFAISLIKKVIEENNLILKNPTSFIGEAGQTNYCMNISVKVWVKNNDYWTVYYQMIKDVHHTFELNKIKMPVQQIELKNK